jgi:CYTH domain-containing protein
MSQEIERKFIVNPNSIALKKVLSGKGHKLENRYYLFRGGGIELRITSLESVTGETYYNFDRMQIVDNSLANRSKDRINISKSEFEELVGLVNLKNQNITPIIRKSYLIAKNPQIEIKVYGGDFEGLVRAEVEFTSTEESDSYTPPDWFGKELTNSPLGNDVKLPDLSKQVFTKLLDDYLNDGF